MNQNIIFSCLNEDYLTRGKNINRVTTAKPSFNLAKTKKKSIYIKRKRNQRKIVLTKEEIRHCREYSSHEQALSSILADNS